MNRSLADAFAADLRTWAQTRDEAALIRALRSSCSGVPHDVAAAYATVAARVGPLLDAIARERVALPAQARDAVLNFARRAGTLGVDTDPLAHFDITIDDAQAAQDDGTPFALAQPATPDERGGVRSRQTHFSASALNAYAECARKWFYRYVCSAVEDPGSSASTYGTAFHAALEDFHADFPQPDPAQEAEMRRRLEGHVNWSFERFRADFGTAVELELQKRRAQRTAVRYIDWLLAEAKRAPFTVIGRETSAELNLDGFAFIGYIDRLDKDDRTGAVSIYDYKTGSIATSAAEYRDKVREFRDFQLPFYYWARTAVGDRVTRLALIPLKDALLDVQPVALEVVPVAAPEKRGDLNHGTIVVADLERARARMIEICRDLTSGALQQFPVAKDPSACTYCAYARSCIDKPHDDREKFGR